MSLLANSNSVRLSMIALANIISAAPKEDEFGVTLTALPKLLRMLTNITKGLDRLTRNNHQRYAECKYRNLNLIFSDLSYVSFVTKLVLRLEKLPLPTVNLSKSSN